MSRLVFICLLVAWSRASAQPPPPPPSAPAPTTPAPAPTPTQDPTSPDPTPSPTPEQAAEMESAKRHFEQAVALFNDGNFPAALAEFEQAYRLRPAAFVHYNIGLTQKALFRYSEAIASLQSYLAGSPTLAPERRAEAEQIISEMKALLADVSITVVPDGATITVDGRPAGSTPLARPLAIAAGTHKIEVTAEGYEPQKRDIMVTAGVPVSIKLELRAIPKTGKVRISSSVPRATVSVDGRPVGEAPLEVELAAGGHQIEVSAPNHLVRRDELVVAAGQTRQLEVTLERIVRPKKRWYKQWYVWTGAAVVLVGGTAACGLAGCFDTQQSPIEGTLAPGAGGVE